MGEMADAAMSDYYSDLVMSEMAELEMAGFREEVSELMGLGEEFLFSETESSDDDLVIGIRNYYVKYKKMSEKQKFRLAEWIAKNCA